MRKVVSRGDDGRRRYSLLLGALVIVVGLLGCQEVTAPPGAYPIKLASERRTSIGRSITVKWEAGTLPSGAALAYSADDGASWIVWKALNSNLPSGAATLLIRWAQFNWSYFSYQKLRSNDSHEQDTLLYRIMGNRLVVRAQAANGTPLSTYLQVDVVPPGWLVGIYALLGMSAAILYVFKTRWDKAPRQDLSGMINFVGTACIATKTTFALAFGCYIVAGALVYHRHCIVRDRRASAYWLTRVYQWVYVAMLGCAVLGVLLGIVMRIKATLFG